MVRETDSDVWHCLLILRPICGRLELGRLQGDSLGDLSVDVRSIIAMSSATAELRGRAMLRPWRVGVLVDTTSGDDVREAISLLSGVWGGYYMPIIHIGLAHDEIEREARRFDVDSLHTLTDEPQLEDFLRRSNLSWAGRGTYGPFGEEEGIRQGILPMSALANAAEDVVIPLWESTDPLDLFYSVQWGRPHKRTPNFADDSEGTPMTLGALYAAKSNSRVSVGRIEASRRHVTAARRYAFDSSTGVFVVRRDSPEELLSFWNTRMYGTKVICLPAEADAELLRYLTRDDLPGVEVKVEGESQLERRCLYVWGLEQASAATVSAVGELAERCSLEVTRSNHHPIPYVFQGVKTPFARSVRADFVPSARSTDVDLPSFPLTDNPNAIWRGVIASEIHVHSVTGQDPRFTAAVPGLRRYSGLMHQLGLGEGVERVRTSEEGVVLGIQADKDQVSIPFAFTLDVFRLLFDDESIVTTQSDVGKFQTRAAQVLGGPLSGFLTQPGVRAALLDAAQKTGGITYQQLVNSVKSNRGEWPDRLRAYNMNENEYGQQQINALLHAGLLVPLLDVHCSHCRVDSQMTPRDLDTTMRCEFCGAEFNLALSLALRKGQWRYRLASHLSADRIKSLLPPLAVMSTIEQLNSAQTLPMSHLLGLEVKLKDGKRVEVDVAMFLPDFDAGVAILGEVKNGNQIDRNDVENLELLQRKLLDADVPCVVLIGTLKERLSPDEVALLRELVERCPVVTLRNGQLVPMMPFVLTAPDVSHPWISEAHPWRWKGLGSSIHGVLGTAISSCERNLGLVGYGIERRGGGWSAACQWADSYGSHEGSSSRGLQ